MANTGNVFPTAGSTVDRAGAAAWTSPGNIVSDNATNATTTTTPTDYLIASSFGFSSSVPANVCIRGITVRVEMAETGTGSSNYVVQLSTDTTPTLVGNVSGTITVTTGPTISTTGGIADLWGTTLTAAQVSAAGFGVTLWSVDTINALQCDYMTIAVEWTDVPNAWDARQYFRKRKNTTHRRLLTAPLNDSNPATPAAPETSDDRTLEATFVTRALRSRRSLSVGWSAALAAAPQAPPAQPITAVLPVRAKRRKHRQGLFLSGGGYVEARVQPQYPSWQEAAGFHRRRETERTRLALEHSPSYPAAQAPPAVPFEATLSAQALRRRETARRLLEVLSVPTWPVFAPLTAWLERRAFRSVRERKPLTVPDHAVYPQTPIQTQPEPAWRAPVKHRIERARTLQKAAPQLEHPATPAVGAQPESAFRAPATLRIERRRRLLPQAPQITYPATPVVSAQPLPAWALPAVHRIARVRRRRDVPRHDSYPVTPIYAANQLAKPLKRRETVRALLRVIHNPAYPSTPAPPQAPTAFKLAEAFRRHGWRTLLVVPELDQRPATPPPAPVTRTGRHVKASSVGRRGHASRERTVQAQHSRRKLDAE